MKRFPRPHALIATIVIVLAGSWAQHGRADAPAGRYTYGNDTVYDTKTLLTWQQVIAPNPVNWNDAKAYCDALTLDGNSNWRLPTVKELQTLVDERRTNPPAIDPTAFMNTPSEGFWTSSPWAGSGSYAWIVYFSNGYASNDYVTDTYLVRCVR